MKNDLVANLAETMAKMIETKTVVRHKRHEWYFAPNQLRQAAQKNPIFCQAPDFWEYVEPQKAIADLTKWRNSIDMKLNNLKAACILERLI